MTGPFEKWLLVSLIVLVPLLFVMNVWQSYQFAQTQRAVSDVQRAHTAVVEENKRLIVGISGLRSPARIRLLAREDLGLVPLESASLRRIQTGDVGERQ